MAPPSSANNPTATATKRLLHELRAQASDETVSPAFEYLQPVREDNLFEWEAGLKGPEGSWYEGSSYLTPLPHHLALIAAYEAFSVR